jgi:hypothetical protein
MPAVGFEPTISAGERPQTYALDRAVTGTGILAFIDTLILNYPVLTNGQSVTFPEDFAFHQHRCVNRKAHIVYLFFLFYGTSVF